MQPRTAEYATLEETIAFLKWLEEQAQAEGETEVHETPTSILMELGMVAIGLVLLVLGAHYLVEAAVTIAQSFGLSELVIGLTVVAVGTSLPEIAG